MKFPTWLKPALFGAAGGAIALAIVGFSWGGWVTGGIGQGYGPQIVKRRRGGCADALLYRTCRRSQLDDDDRDDGTQGRVDLLAQGNREKAGWATPLGAEKPNADLAQACQLKLAEAF